MALTLLGFLAWAISTATAGTAQSLLIGEWTGADRASQARYGRIWVTESFIQWSGSRYNPGCRVRYSLVAEESGSTYPDALATPFDPPGLAQPESGPALPLAADTRPQYHIFRLTLQNRRCISQRSALQFAIPTNTPRRAELVTYDRHGKAVSWSHLERLPD